MLSGVREKNPTTTNAAATVIGEKKTKKTTER